MESSLTPERAVPSAQRLMGIVPWAGHMVHMPGHIWIMLADYDNAAAVNERAAEVDREYFARTGVMSFYYYYYLHNLHFILYSRAMQGRLAETRQAAERYLQAVASTAQTMPSMADSANLPVTMAYLRLERWDDLPVPKPPSGKATALVWWHYQRASAFTAKVQREAARTEQAQFDRVRSSLDTNMLTGTNSLVDVMEVASAILEASLAATPRTPSRNVSMP